MWFDWKIRASDSTCRTIAKMRLLVTPVALLAVLRVTDSAAGKDPKGAINVDQLTFDRLIKTHDMYAHGIARALSLACIRSRPRSLRASARRAGSCASTASTRTATRRRSSRSCASAWARRAAAGAPTLCSRTRA